MIKDRPSTKTWDCILLHDWLVDGKRDGLMYVQKLMGKEKKIEKNRDRWSET